MAYPTGTVFEIRTTGLSTNGGGYIPGGVGTDHSQQDAVWSNGTDLVIDGADNTKVTSAGVPFATDDVGNIINIASGVNFTPARYAIKDVTAGVATLDVACGTVGATGGTWYLGGAMSSLEDFYGDLTSYSGYTVWIKKGTYTLLANHDWRSKDGWRDEEHYVIIGYNSTRGDSTVANDRPLLSNGAYYLWTGSHTSFQNIRITGTASPMLIIETNSLWSNAKIENTSGTSGRRAVQFSLFAAVFNSELSSTNGTAIYTTTSARIINNYVRDSVVGIDISGGSLIDFNVVDTCVTGLLLTGAYDSIIKNNIIYNSTLGMSLNNITGCFFSYNNIIDTCTTGASNSSSAVRNYFDYNNWHGNGTDVSNIEKGTNALALDPEFIDAPSGNFGVGENMKASSPFPGGLSTSYLDLGAVQREEPAGGGGQTSYTWVG